MDHLKEAKEFAGAAECADDDALADRHAQLAIAHALIAWVEQMRQSTKDAEVAAERADLICERLAQRRAAKRIL